MLYLLIENLKSGFHKRAELTKSMPIKHWLKSVEGSRPLLPPGSMVSLFLDIELCAPSLTSILFKQSYLYSYCLLSSPIDLSSGDAKKPLELSTTPPMASHMVLPTTLGLLPHVTPGLTGQHVLAVSNFNRDQASNSKLLKILMPLHFTCLFSTK